MSLPEGFQLEAQSLPEGFQLETPKPRKPYGEAISHGIILMGQRMKRTLGAAPAVWTGRTLAKLSGFKGDMPSQELDTILHAEDKEMLQKMPTERAIQLMQKPGLYETTLGKKKQFGLYEELDTILKSGEKKLAEDLINWGQKTKFEVSSYLKEHPELAMQLDAKGLLGQYQEIFSKPEMLVQGLIESSSMMMEAVVGTILGGPIGGTIAMMPEIFGDVYLEGIDDGESHITATIHALVDSYLEARIENWSLGKDIHFAKAVFKGELRGIKKLSWNVLKIFLRGSAEESSQQYVRNSLRWLFADRSQQLMEGVSQSFAFGGPMETAMAGMMGGAAFAMSPNISAQNAIDRIDKFETAINESPTISDTTKTEMHKSLDDIVGIVVEDFIELTKGKYNTVIEDNKSLEEVGNQIAKDFGFKENIKWKFVKKNRRIGRWGTHRKVGDIHEIEILSHPGHSAQSALQETIVHELGHIAKPPISEIRSPLSKLPKNFEVYQEDFEYIWRVRDKKKPSMWGFGKTKEEAIDDALRHLNNTRQYPRRKIHYPEFKEWIMKKEKDLYEAIKLSAPGENYNEAISKKVINPWIRGIKAGPNNKGRWLAVQFSNELLNQEEDSRAKRYYDKLYSGVRKGYYRLKDFWEIPKWITYVNNIQQYTDVYIVRNIDEAKQFLPKAGYDKVLFSNLDINAQYIKELVEGYNGDIIAGGYGEGLTELSKYPNVKVYKDIKELASEEGRPLASLSGINYRNFYNSNVIPRLTMSAGCLFKCAFCNIPKEIKIIPKEQINLEIKEIAHLNPELVYIDDKTFGQADNYEYISKANKSLKSQATNFKGFIIQTSASQFNKFTDEFLQESGIKYVEIGIESFNDKILKDIHKPASEKSILEAVEKARKNNIAVIPNIIIGLPGETVETYKHTIDFIKQNSDVISHLNIYNLALYPGTEISTQLESKEDIDIDENKVAKSFHKDSALHENYATVLYALGEELLNKPSIAELTTPVEEKREYAKQPQISRKKLLALGHKIPQLMNLTDEERRDAIESVTGKRSLKYLTREELETVIDYFKNQYGKDVEIKPEDMDKPIQVGDRVTTMSSVLNETVKGLDELPQQVNIPKHITKRFRNKIRESFPQTLKDLFFGVDNYFIPTLSLMLDNGKRGIFTDVFVNNIQRGYRNLCTHTHSVFGYIRQQNKLANITDKDLSQMSLSLNPQFQFVEALKEKYGESGTDIITVEINGKDFDLTYADLIDIFLTIQQEDGQRHALVGGFMINGVLTGSISQEKLVEMVEHLEKNKKAMLQVKHFMETEKNVWKPSLNNTSLKLNEKKIATVKNWWGLEVYYPKKLAGAHQKFEVNLIENKSILKDRTKSSAPLIVRDAFDKFAKFETAIAEYSAMAEPTRIIRTVLNQTKIANIIDQKGYGKIRHHILTILERAQSIPAEQGSFGRFLNKILHGGYRALLYLNPRVWLSQYTSSINYAAYCDNKYIKLIKNGLSAKAMEETLKLSDIAWHRFYMGQSSFELGEISAHDATLRAFTGKASDINKLGIMLKGADLAALAAGLEIAKAEYVDAQRGTVTGESAEYWGGKQVNFEEGSEGWRQVVTQRAEWLWQQTQPSWDKWNRSMITSEPDIAKRMFFLFRSFHEKALNITAQAGIEYGDSAKTFDDTTRYAHKVGAVIGSYAFNIVLRSIVLALMARKLKKPIEYIIDIAVAPLQIFPIVGKIVDTAVRNFIRTFWEMKPEYRGRTAEPFVLNVINLMAQAPDNFSQAAAYYLTGRIEEGNKSFMRGLGKTYESVGVATGIPVYEIRKITRGFEEEPVKRGHISRRRGGRRR